MGCNFGKLELGVGMSEVDSSGNLTEVGNSTEVDNSIEIDNFGSGNLVEEYMPDRRIEVVGDKPDFEDGTPDLET